MPHFLAARTIPIRYSNTLVLFLLLVVLISIGPGLDMAVAFAVVLGTRRESPAPCLSQYSVTQHPYTVLVGRCVCIALRYAMLHCVALHCAMLHCAMLHCVSFRFVPFRSVTLRSLDLPTAFGSLSGSSQPILGSGLAKFRSGSFDPCAGASKGFRPR